jgi:integrase
MATELFEGLTGRQLPTLHEIRALSSHLYARAGYDVSAVQYLMAHTDPDMTRAYQKGRARKLLRVDMILPYSVIDGLTDERSGVNEPRATYAVSRRRPRENSLRIL